MRPASVPKAYFSKACVGPSWVGIGSKPIFVTEVTQKPYKNQIVNNAVFSLLHATERHYNDCFVARSMRNQGIASEV